MITGHVRANEAVVSIVLVGPDRELEIPTVIDTGFNGEFVLPANLMSEFGQGKVSYSESILADGTSVKRRSMYVEFYFPGKPTRLYRERTIELGHEVLIGMRLLDGYRLSIDVIEGGNVSIEPLAPKF